MKRCFLLWLVSLGALAATMLMLAGGASAAAPYTCSGSFDNPGVLSGTYSTNVVVSGACVTGGPTTVAGNVILLSGSVLFADDFTATGNLHVGSGATLVGGPQTDADERVLQQYADKAAYYEEQEIETRLARGSSTSSIRTR